MRGITLVELMVCVTIFAIVTSLGLPRLSAWVAQDQVTKQTNELIAQLSLMRAESIQRQREVLLCPSQGGICETEQSSAVPGRRLYLWGQEVTMAARGGGDVAIEFADSQDHYLQQHTTTPDVLLLANRKKFSFDPRGQAVSGSIYVCAEHAQGRRIVISAFGRVRVEPNPQACELVNL